MTERELEDIGKRCRAATPGPWQSEWAATAVSEERLISSGSSDVVAGMWWDGPRGACTQEDADFIARARQDVPNLLVEVARLQGELEDANAHVKRLKNLGPEDKSESVLNEPVGLCYTDRRIRQALADREPVVICHNNETGTWLWSVAIASESEFWLSSFETRTAAFEYCREHQLPVESASNEPYPKTPGGSDD